MSNIKLHISDIAWLQYLLVICINQVMYILNLWIVLFTHIHTKSKLNIYTKSKLYMYIL